MLILLLLHHRRLSGLATNAIIGTKYARFAQNVNFGPGSAEGERCNTICCGRIGHGATEHAPFRHKKREVVVVGSQQKKIKTNDESSALADDEKSAMEDTSATL